jgi:hypothetical protein
VNSGVESISIKFLLVTNPIDHESSSLRSWYVFGQLGVPPTPFTNYEVSRRLAIIFGIATGYGLDDRRVWVRVPVGPRIFSSPQRPDRLWGPPNLLFYGYRCSLPGVYWPGREADHLPPTSVDVKETYLYINYPIHLDGIVLNKHRDNITFVALHAIFV